MAQLRDGTDDRYSAYQAMKQVKEGRILLAFCWAHVRRDFLQVARSWPAEELWAMGWVERIGPLYQANDARLEVADRAESFAPKDAPLRQQVEAMAEQARQERSAARIHPARQGVLKSLPEHGEGLTVFASHPEVPLDNHTAERAQRGPVVLRKNRYGSGAVWAGERAARLFSVLQTLCLWNINPRIWLGGHLQTCAEAGGQAPPTRSAWLPWNLTEQQRKEGALEAQPDNSS